MLLISKLSKHKIAHKQRIKESEIFHIKIPAEPYKFKQGVGFVSENSLSRAAGILSALQGLQSEKNKIEQSKIIKIPTKFLGNGKLSLKSNSYITNSEAPVTPATSPTSPAPTTGSRETTTPTTQPVVEMPETTEQPPEPSTTETVEQIAAPLSLLYQYQPVIVPASTMWLRQPQGGRLPAFSYFSRYHVPRPPPPARTVNPYQVLWRPLHSYFYG